MFPVSNDVSQMGQESQETAEHTPIAVEGD
jgi:hypothetical protein